MAKYEATMAQLLAWLNGRGYDLMSRDAFDATQAPDLVSQCANLKGCWVVLPMLDGPIGETLCAVGDNLRNVLEAQCEVLRERERFHVPD